MFNFNVFSLHLHKLYFSFLWVLSISDSEYNSYRYYPYQIMNTIAIGIIRDFFIIKYTLPGNCQCIAADPNTASEESKFIHLVMRIELTRAILSPRLSVFLEKFDHPFSQVFIFGSIFT